MKHKQQCSALEAGERSLHHHAIIRLDFPVGIENKKIIPYKGYKSSELMKLIFGQNKTYSEHLVKSAEQLATVISDLHRGGGDEAINKTYISCGNTVRPLRDRFTTPDAESRAGHYQRLCNDGNRAFRHNLSVGRHEDYVEDTFPLITLTRPRGETRDNQTSTTSVGFLSAAGGPDALVDRLNGVKSSPLGNTGVHIKEPSLIVATPFIYFPKSERHRQDFWLRDTAKPYIGWNIETHAAIGSEAAYMRIERALAKTPPRGRAPTIGRSKS